MFDFTEGIKKIEDLYKQNKYQEVIEKSNEYAAQLNPNHTEDRKLLYIFSNHLFNSYFKLSREKECVWYLEECTRFATTDEETRKAFHNRIRLAINTGKAHEEMDTIEDNLRYYKSINKTVSIADTLYLKGRATKDIECFQEALKLYRECEEDTTYEEELTLKQIKELRHLS